MEIKLASSSEVAIWRRDFFKEYVPMTGFSAYMGASKNNIIRVGKELLTTAGKTVNIPLIMSLRGSGVTGSQILVGNEDELANYNDQVKVDWKRNGVVVPKSEQYLTQIDLWNAGKDALTDWAATEMRYDLVDAFGQIIVPGSTSGDADSGVLYANATAAQRNTFLTNNMDRILFGAALGNSSSGVWATALATVDSTADKMTTAIVSQAKRLADKTGRKNATYPDHAAITPYTTKDGVYRGYVLFCAGNSFRDLQNDSAMQQANRDARQRNVSNNPIFQDGDLIWDGVIIRKIPELDNLTVSNGTINVDRNFLCGQGALSVGWGQMPRPTVKKEDDYGFRPGAGIEELRGQKKTSFAGTQYGCVEVLTASVDDA